MNSNYTIILGSQSPRRKQLLEDAGFRFIAVALDVDESFSERLEVNEVAQIIAKRKADHYQGSLKSSLLITADTVVIRDAKILGKPANREEAHRMLRSLSGRSHKVITGVCIKSEQKTHIFSDVTEVTFKELTDPEINYYIDHYAPLDKAGAYGIQEWIGLIGITEIKGSFYNVMGMPVHKLYQVLGKEFNYTTF